MTDDNTIDRFSTFEVVDINDKKLLKKIITGEAKVKSIYVEIGREFISHCKSLTMENCRIDDDFTDDDVCRNVYENLVNGSFGPITTERKGDDIVREIKIHGENSENNLPFTFQWSIPG